MPVPVGLSLFVRYHLPVMLPARRTDSAHDHSLQTAHDQSLQSAVDRLTGGLSDRPDSPDGWVTAVRRLPPRAAQYAPFPDGARRTAAAGAGGARHRAALHAPGRGDRARAGRPQRRRHHADRVGQDALLQRAGAATRSCRIRRRRALYLFPTKALAQDQLAELHEMCAIARRVRPSSRSACSPTTATRRRTRAARSGRARTSCSAIPDMVHSGILPHHPRWAKLFENLRYVVIDELHAYRGVFGSHLTQRAAAAAAHLPALRIESGVHLLVGDDRQPARAGRSARRAAVRAVDESGAPRGEKFFVFVNPPVVNQQLGIRRSYLGETRRIASEFLKRNLQLIVFAQSRLSTEILTTYLKDDFDGAAGRAGADPRLSRRLPAAAPPRDRERAARGQRCARWSRPTRWSSASTSARSTSA